MSPEETGGRSCGNTSEVKHTEAGLRYVTGGGGGGVRGVSQVDRSGSVVGLVFCLFPYRIIFLSFCPWENQ